MALFYCLVSNDGYFFYFWNYMELHVVAINTR